MRVATLTQQQLAVSEMFRQQAALAVSQAQVSSGKKIQSPADDPAGAAQLESLQRSLDAASQYATNANTAQNRLSSEEQALADATNVLQRVQELAIQSTNATLDDPSRKLIGVELKSRVQEMLDIANRQDAGGEYLFSGLRTGTQPFARSSAGVNYVGDNGARAVQIGPSQNVIDSHSGFDTFVNIPGGNGTFTTSVNASNSGTSIIDAGTVFNRAAWVPGSYTLNFTSATTWSVTDASSATVATGNYTDGAPIDFNGARVTVTGVPASGDSYAIAPAGKQDIFTTLNSLVAAVDSNNITPALKAQFSSKMTGLIQQLTQGSDHLSAVRSEVGARLSAIDTAANARDSLNVELQSTMSQIQDVDYASAITKMNAQLLGLQAAQQSYAKVSHLSLFDYM